MIPIIGIPKQEARILSIDPSCSAKSPTAVHLREGDKLLTSIIFTASSYKEMISRLTKIIRNERPDIVVLDNVGIGREVEESLNRVFT